MTSILQNEQSYEKKNFMTDKVHTKNSEYYVIWYEWRWVSNSQNIRSRDEAGYVFKCNCNKPDGISKRSTHKLIVCCAKLSYFLISVYN